MEPRSGRHTRDVAMLEDNRSYGDERRDAGRHDHGMTTSHESEAPGSAAAASNTPANRSHRGAGGSQHSKSDLLEVEASQPDSRYQRHSREPSRDGQGRSLSSSNRRSHSHRKGDRGRESGRIDEKRHTGLDHRYLEGSRHGSDRNLREHESPPASKRRRSRSPSRTRGASSKRSRREPSPGRGRGRRPSPYKDSRRTPLPLRGLSPEARGLRPGPDQPAGTPASLNSPGRDRSSSRARAPRYHTSSPGSRAGPVHSREPSSRATYRSRSPSRRRSRERHRRTRPLSSERRRPDSPGAYFDRPPGPDPHSPPRSPQQRRAAKRSKQDKKRDKARLSNRPELASGANSVEVNMSARGGFRGNFNSHGTGPYAGKGQYGQGSHINDSRGYAQSSGRGTPNSSFHGSPPSQSPYNGSGRGWGGQQQFSPPHGQFPGHFGNGGPYPPTGPGQYHNQNNQGFSPQYGPPTGPAAQQYPSGPSFRGGFRGGRGSGGNGFNSGRGGHRGGGFKSNQWHANSQPGSGSVRSQTAHSDDAAQSSTSPVAAASHHGDGQKERPGDDEDADAAEDPRRSSMDLQAKDDDMTGEPEQAEMGPPSRPPPTGPQSSKFSFAFKGPSKPAVVAPKPDISSKFNAAPQRRDQQASDDRAARDLPKSVPTEPASARARAAEQRQHAEHTPRTRKVKKTMKRPKPRPTLPPDLATSDSVFFRKPGNESVIGSGTYGKVFKGLNVYTKNLVALKKIRMEGERDGFPVTAVREIKLLQSLKHTNIVKLQEVMVEKNDCFMVFEYLSHDLTGLLNHPSFKLDAAQKKHLAKQLFEGLDYLHNRGVLHRDIKAANILVSSEGILKLADFGLARFYAKRHQLDYTNRVITIWYRSPELLLGETQYGPAVDIWSAACVLVEIFTRHAIFPGDGGEISQLDKIYAVLGTPNKAEWPNLVEMPWFELLRPSYRKPNVFAEKYQDKLTPAAFDLLAAMFRYDPATRPTASEVLEHAYFTTEEPEPRQAIELRNLDGDWHEFESKALRREKERQEKEARRAAAREVAGGSSMKDVALAARDKDRGREREKERKRPMEPLDSAHGLHREAKRMHVDPSDAADASAPSRPDRVPSAASITSGPAPGAANAVLDSKA